MRTVEEKETLRIIAHHEAAHGVVYVALGFGGCRLSLRCDAELVHGLTRFWNLHFPMPRDLHFKAAVMIAAGKEGERLADGRDAFKSCDFSDDSDANILKRMAAEATGKHGGQRAWLKSVRNKAREQVDVHSWLIQDTADRLLRAYAGELEMPGDLVRKAAG
jgi:hypothetical protein